MPPKTKVSREQIIDSAMKIVRKSGEQSLNARALATQLGCSTQPVFSNFGSMSALLDAVIAEAKEIYGRYIDEGIADKNYNGYKGSGMAYIRFGRDEPMLFRLLFMHDRTKENSKAEYGQPDNVISLIEKNAGLCRETACDFNLQMWMFVHGIATMVATGFLSWNESVISGLLTKQYHSMLACYKPEGKDNLNEYRSQNGKSL